MNEQDQLVELQILLMDQQQAIEQMSQQLIGHDNKITELCTTLEIIKFKIGQLLEATESGQFEKISPMDEKPPHY